jgi:hypothetical protein
MERIVRGNRVIHLDGGTYNERIEGNYVEGKQKETPSQRTERNITNESEVIDGRKNQK